MSEPLVTFDSLFPPDPAAADNSGGTEGTPSAGGGLPSSGAPAGSSEVTARITELERLVSRHRDQLNGNQAEIARLRAENEALRTHRPEGTPGTANAQPAVPRKAVSLVEATQKLLLDNDDSLLKEYESLQHPSTGLVTVEQLNQALAEREARQQTLQQQTIQTQTLQQALIGRHPEFLNVQQHPMFLNAVAARYQELSQDAVAQALYPPDPSKLIPDPTTGQQYDMRILFQAANEVKARGGQTPPVPPSLGVTQGGGPAPTGPKVPSRLVAADSALNHPAMQAWIQEHGWGTSPREQLSKIVALLPEATKAKWARGEL